MNDLSRFINTLIEEQTIVSVALSTGFSGDCSILSYSWEAPEPYIIVKLDTSTEVIFTRHIVSINVEDKEDGQQTVST